MIFRPLLPPDMPTMGKKGWDEVDKIVVEGFGKILLILVGLLLLISFVK